MAKTTSESKTERLEPHYFPREDIVIQAASREEALAKLQASQDEKEETK